MTQSMAATHSFGKFATDKIFGAASAANAAKAKFGKENVVDATIGVLLDETEALVCLPTVEKAFRALPMPEVCAYAPIEGLGDFLNAVLVEAFADNKPDAYIKAVATSGGSGAIHHTIYNYSEFGDAVLTSDWFWGPYRVLADGLVRKLETYTLYNEANKFNVKSFEAKVNELLAKQKSLVILLNTPAHNPTGYSLDNSEWDQVLEVLKVSAKNPDKKITLFVDIAYIDYAGERNASRSFLEQIHRPAGKPFGGCRLFDVQSLHRIWPAHRRDDRHILQRGRGHRVHEYQPIPQPGHLVEYQPRRPADAGQHVQ